MAVTTLSAVLVRVADAIAEEINATTFDRLKLNAVRSYADWDELLEDQDGEILCDVVPVIHRDAELDSRGSVVYRCEVDVGLRLRFKPEDRDGGRIDIDLIDRMVLIVELLHEHFCHAGNGRRLADYEEAVWIETKIRQSYVRKHLREAGQFTGIIRLTYDVPK